MLLLQLVKIGTIDDNARHVLTGIPIVNVLPKFGNKLPLII